MMVTNLLQRLVVDKAGSILGNLELPLLDLLAELPTTVSAWPFTILAPLPTERMQCKREPELTC